MDEGSQVIEFVETTFVKLAKLDFVPFFSKSLTKVINGIHFLSIPEGEIVSWNNLIADRGALTMSEALDKLGLHNQPERLKVVALLSAVNMEKANALSLKNPAAVMDQINHSLESNRLTSRIPPEVTGIIMRELKKIEYSKNAIYNIELIMSHGLVVDVLPYVGRHQMSSLTDLQKTFDAFANIRTEMMTPIGTHNDLANEIISVLLKQGHSKLSLDNKDLASLYEIVLRHYFAIKAMLLLRTQGNSGPLSKNFIADKIALEIVWESETT